MARVVAETGGWRSAARTPAMLRTRGRRWAIVMFGALVPLTIIALLHAPEPDGPARAPHLIALLALGLTCAFGPYCRGARPLRIWIFQTMGFLCFTASFVSPWTNAGMNTFESGWFFALAGYTSTATWLVALTYRVARNVALRDILDTASISAAAMILLWTVAGRVEGTGFQTALTLSILPTLDLVLIALVAHLLMRQGNRFPLWRWLLAGWILQLTLNTIHALAGPGGWHVESPFLTSGSIFVYWMLAVAFTHPSIEILGVAVQETASVEFQKNGARGLVLLFGALVCVVAAMTFPVQDLFTSMARTVLVTVVLIVLFVRLLLTMRDLHRSETERAYRAVHDSLTGLPNRQALLATLKDRLEGDDAASTQAAASPGEPPGMIALFSIDCDNFKRVNDTWGHPAGDRLLREIGTRLSSRLRPQHLLARHGGDEFLLLADVACEREACALAEQVQEFFTHPLPVMYRRSHVVSASIGVALADRGGGASVEQMLREADIALYAAKGRGLGQYAIFDSELDERSAVQSRIADALPLAIADGSIEVHLQVILTGEGYGTVAGWEALSRWTDPVLGRVCPDAFIEAAEKLGLVEELGEAMLRRACHEAVRLRGHLDLPDAVLTVNVSALQLQQPNFADIVADALARSGLPGDRLWLEITESLLVESTEHVLATLESIHELGVLICIDDFGTGYASLDGLLRLPVDCVKIDRVLTSHLVQDSSTIGALRALLDLMRALGIERIVAEGVETREQEASLAANGVPMVQGWLYGCAAPAETHLARHRAPAAQRAAIDGLTEGH